MPDITFICLTCSNFSASPQNFNIAVQNHPPILYGFCEGFLSVIMYRFKILSHISPTSLGLDHRGMSLNSTSNVSLENITTNYIGSRNIRNAYRKISFCK